MKSKKSLPSFTNVFVEDSAAEGKAIAKVDDMVVFIPFAAPGDVVDIHLTKKKKNFAEAKIIQFKDYSTDREKPFCTHFGVCGGCKWQHIIYEKQLYYKQKQVVDHLQRIGKIQIREIKPILGSTQTVFYRNKLEFTFSNKAWLTADEMNEEMPTQPRNALGFHIPTLFDKVLDIKKCWLQDDVSNQIRNELKQFAEKAHMSFFDLRKQEGWLRTLIIRTSSTGEIMVILVFFYEDEKPRKQILQFLVERFPQITSCVYVINSKANDTITDQQIHLFSGRDYIWEEMEGLRFKIGPKSFYQTNSLQAYELYKVVRNFAQLTGNELVYDLYTGTGTIANFIAKNARKVIGIEFVPEAIEDAMVNATVNGISNTHFFAGDIKEILNDNFLQTHGFPEVIVTDPPRNGMHNDVINKLLEIKSKRIVYVSCNSATQARDLQLLNDAYEVLTIQPVDMFPHTHHVENVALLSLREP
ncbi:MAG: 23S rRNA (uracil(1939)-C(5))-methyltransferase RlmD [Microbacter sp.]